MKKKYIFIICIFFISTFVSCYRNKSTNSKQSSVYASFLKADSLECNLGIIRDTTKTISYDFILRNIAKKNIFISYIPTACDCIKVFYSKKAIPYNGKMRIRIQYDISGVKGYFSKQFYVVLNDGKYYTILSLSGRVI